MTAHGTIASYVYDGCRCSLCTAAHVAAEMKGEGPHKWADMVRLRQICKEEGRPSYSTCMRLHEQGQLDLYRLAGTGPVYVRLRDLDALWKPLPRKAGGRVVIGRRCEVCNRAAVADSAYCKRHQEVWVPPSGAVPQRRRCRDCNRISIDGVHCSDHITTKEN